MKFDDIAKNHAEKEIREYVGPLPPHFRYHYDTVMNAPEGAIVELGVQTGTIAVFLCGAADEKGTHYYGIDPWRGDPHGRFVDMDVTRKLTERNLNALNLKNYTLIRDCSYNVAPTFNKPIAVIFIDGCHCKECVLKDFYLWAPKVVKGGTMIFHDAGWDTVGAAIREFIKSEEFKKFTILKNAPVESYRRMED